MQGHEPDRKGLPDEAKTLLGAATACALLTAPAAAFGATIDRSDYLGHRLSVKVDQELFYDKLPGGFTGSLQRGQTFKVERLSPSGKYAYGLAYGGVKRHVYVETAGLDAKASVGDTPPRFAHTPSVRGGADGTLALVRLTDALDRPGNTAFLATPHLSVGTKVNKLGGAEAPGTYGNKSRHCYIAGVGTPGQKKPFRDHQSIRLGFNDGAKIVRTTRVRFRSAPGIRDTDFKEAAKRMGCGSPGRP